MFKTHEIFSKYGATVKGIPGKEGFKEGDLSKVFLNCERVSRNKISTEDI